MRNFHVTVFGLTFAAASSLTPLKAAGFGDTEYASCDNFLPVLRQVGEARVGPESCQMQEMEFDFNGRDFVRVDMGLDGTAEGYVKMDGPYHEYLSNGPDLIFEQAATPGEASLAIARYERMKGAAVILVYPKSGRDWNGKVWVTAHGRGRSFQNGSLKVWHDYLDFEIPMEDLDKIDRLILSKGYALAKTYRTSVEDSGEIFATLEDGTVVDWAAFNDTASIIKDFSLVAKAAIKDRLGKAPSRTYLYGHSAGARIARSINYTPGVNTDSRGERVFDGFIMDDSATGLWLPVVMKNGRNILFSTEKEKQAFTPQIELDHQMNTKVWTRAPDRPEWVSNAYLINKRNNARILMEKGLGSKFRHYEIRQLDHANGAGLADGRNRKVRILDLSLMIDGVIDMLDGLVEGRKVPAPSRSDWAVIGDADNDGVIEYPAISFPEVACPLGIFYPYPHQGAGSTTAFAAFTGEGTEPLDEKNIFVDMNRNGVWDLRETPTEAWRRLGLLESTEELTRPKYVSCIRDAATQLSRDGFFSDKTVESYIQQAQKQDLKPAYLDNLE